MNMREFMFIFLVQYGLACVFVVVGLLRGGVNQ
jgi:hypothetical protein